MSIVVEGKEYMRNGRGALVPLETVKPLDILRDQTVRKIADVTEEMSKALKQFKESVLEDFEEFCLISLEKYDKKQGGQKGNISLTTYDGLYKVEVKMQDVLSFDEQLQVAKELVDECIVKWSDGASPELRALVNDAFQVDKAGNVNTRRILELRRLEIEDEDWQKAMGAISASIRVDMSRKYMRVYRKNKTGDGYTMIPLDFASI